MQDVVIVGGGVIGLSLAYELAGQGVSCALFDQGALGQESSWAGAGILVPGQALDSGTPEARLRAASHRRWPDWSARLREETGIDNGFRRCGGLEVRCGGSPEALLEEVAHWKREGEQVTPLHGTSLWECEPHLSRQVTTAYRLPELGQVRNPRHVKALIAACLRRGVQMHEGTPCWGFDRAGERITAIRTSQGRMAAGQFVVASGAWSGALLADCGAGPRIRPLRGQMVLLKMSRCPIQHVINVGPRYLVPRDDGRTLIGSTEEIVGFDKRTTAAGLAGLLEFGLQVVPLLAEAQVERNWAGLRPQSADGLPYLGRVPGVENLFVAAGHFRAGLQLSPITAELLAQVLLGRNTTLPLPPFAVDRPTPALGSDWQPWGAPDQSREGSS